MQTHHVALAALLLCAGTAQAQTSLQTTTGALPGDQLGDALAIVGDLDRDGHADLAIGAPFADVNGLSSGSVRIVSGRTGAQLFVFHGPAAGDRLGESVAAAGDLDNDGWPDIVAGAPNHDTNGSNAGMARVWSGRTGAVLFTWHGDAAGDWFGASVDGAGDANGDGRPDVIVGAPYGKGSNTSNVGEARLFSGLNGSVLRTFNSPQGVSVLGMSVSGAGDVDRDGFADVILGAPQATYGFSDQGRAWVFSGRTGASLRYFQGTSAGENFGYCVDGGRDINNDGWPDFVVGSPFADYQGANSGSVFVYSGRDGAQLHHFRGTAASDDMGRSCAHAGDVDGDGFADVIGGARLKDQGAANAGMARVWSGRTGGVLNSVYGTSVDEMLGHAVAGGADVNGDGLDDFVVGWPTFDNGAASYDAGRARAYSAAPLPVTSYCTAGTSVSGCTATLTTTGLPSASASTPFVVRANGVLRQSTGFLFYGRHGQATPYGSGWLCVTAPFVRLISQGTLGSATGSVCSGFLQQDLNAHFRSGPDLAVHAGDTLFCQAFFRDSGSGLSNAVLFTVQP
jgi:hypothetical protein